MHALFAGGERHATVDPAALRACPLPEVWDAWLYLGWELLRRAISPIGIWRQRAWERRTLGRMSEHELKDLGLTPQLACWEINKPFWKA